MENETNGTAKDVNLKNEPEKLLKIKRNGQKTNRNEPENEVQKSLKTNGRRKNEPETNRNEPKNEATDLIENKRG